MQLKDALETYHYHTGKAGDVGRPLALGGIAVVWLLHGDQTALVFEKLLLWALAGFCLFLALDFLQFFASAGIWGIYRRLKEKEFEKANIGADTQFKAPNWINWTGISFFVLKGASLLVAAIFLGVFIARRIIAA